MKLFVRQSRVIILALLLGAGLTLWAGPIRAVFVQPDPGDNPGGIGTGGGGGGALASPNYHQVTIYQGVAAVTTNTWAVMELGNNGTDIASTGNINIRPNGNDEFHHGTITLSANPAINPGYGELDLSWLCFTGVTPSVCVNSGAVAAGDDSYWQKTVAGASSILSPKTASDGVQIGTLDSASALSTSALEVYANTTQPAAIFNDHVVTAAIGHDPGDVSSLTYTGGGNVLLNGQVTAGSGLNASDYPDLIKFHLGRIFVGLDTYNYGAYKYPYLTGNTTDANHCCANDPNSACCDKTALMSGYVAEPWTSNDYYSLIYGSPHYHLWSGIDADTFVSQTPNLDFTDTSVHPVELFWKYWEDAYVPHAALCVKTDKAKLCDGGSYTGKDCSTPAQQTLCVNGGGTCQAMCSMQTPSPTCPADPASFGTAAAPLGSCAKAKRCDGDERQGCQIDSDCWVGWSWIGPCGYGPTHTALHNQNPSLFPAVDQPQSCESTADCQPYPADYPVGSSYDTGICVRGKLETATITRGETCAQKCAADIKCQGNTVSSCQGSTVRYNKSTQMDCSTFYVIPYQTTCNCDCTLDYPVAYNSAAAGSGDLCSGSTTYGGQSFN